MVIEAGKSHHLLSVSWRPRKTGHVVPNFKQFSFLRTRKSNGIRLRGWRPENQKFCPGKEKINFSVQAEKKIPSSAFHSVQALSGLDDAHQKTTRVASTQLLVQVLKSSRDTLTGTPRNNVLSAMWASFSPVKLTHKVKIEGTPFYTVGGNVN